jgi:hypothetical protein
MPVMSFFGVWDSFVSAALYSGNKNKASIVFEEEKLPSQFAGIASKMKETGKVSFTVFSWSMDILHVPSYDEERVYRQIYKKVCNVYGDYDPEMIISGKRYLWIGAQEEQSFSCADF